LLTPEESMAQEFAEDDGMDVAVHALDATPISFTTVIDPPPAMAAAASC